MSQEPTEEELRAYMDQLRSAPAEEVIAQAFSMLAAAAEAKLGETDARVLIDGIAGLTQATGSRLGQLGAQMSQGVSQLQMAQVQREKPANGSEGEDGDDAGAPTTGAQPPDARGAGAGAATGPGQAGPAQGEPTQERMTDRLWMPGRGPRPPTG